MANEQQVQMLRQGAKAWNAWRDNNLAAELDLRGADLRGARLEKTNLEQADLRDADLSKATLDGANLRRADLRGADLHSASLLGANLSAANLQGADLSMASLYNATLVEANLREARLFSATLYHASLRGADLSGAELVTAQLGWADFQGAKLQGADLRSAQLVRTCLKQADLSKCKVYGIAAWDVVLDAETQQHDLVITDQESITVDNLEIAQFIYLLLRNEKIRDVIDTITSKVVLILGRFSNERKPVLDEIRAKLRDDGLVPILFDFEKPTSKDVTGTVETLARMARFIIADLTDPSSIPHELATLVPHMRTTPVVPIRLKGSGGYSMFDDYERSYDKWVLPRYEYDDAASLIENLEEKVIAPARARADQLQRRAGDSDSQ